MPKHAIFPVCLSCLFTTAVAGYRECKVCVFKCMSWLFRNSVCTAMMCALEEGITSTTSTCVCGEVEVEKGVPLCKPGRPVASCQAAAG